MADLVLQPGVHTAKFTYTPPSSYVGLALNLDFFLSVDGGVTKTIDAGLMNFTVVPGGNQITVQITIPSTPTVYRAYIVIDDGTQFLVGFADTNNIIIGGGGSITPVIFT